MKIKLGIDFTYIKEDSITGIRMHGEEILKGLGTKLDKYEIVLFIDKRLEESFNFNFPQYKKVCIKVLFENIRYVRAINYRTYNKWHIGYLMKKEKCDIILHPYVNEFTTILGTKNEIITIHDIIPLDVIENKESKLYKKYKNDYIKIMNKSKSIITISEYSKKRLLEINENYKGIIVVIPNTISKLPECKKNIKTVLGSNKKYIFTINSFLSHKNQITLVKAFNQIKDKIPHNLVLVGRPELASSISAYNMVLQYINDNKLNDRVMVKSNISDEEKSILFYNTDLFVSTSLQEGFGRTPVEAAMCKVPVISTRETSLPEATMEMLYYYNNPTDEEELAEKIIEVLNNKPSKEELEKISDKLEKEYNKEKIINSYEMLMKKIVKENNCEQN